MNLCQTIYQAREIESDRLLRLRGERSCADSARGTRPSGLPSIACGRDESQGKSVHPCCFIPPTGRRDEEAAAV